MENLRFDGDDYKHRRDSNRLTGQLLRIWDAIKDGEWITLEELAIKSDSPAASASAQLRNLRKERFGSHVIDRERMNNGGYKYRLNNKHNKFKIEDYIDWD